MRSNNLLVLALGLVASADVIAPMPEAPGHRAHLGSEVRRLRAHFDSVQTELLESDIGMLRSGQRMSRARLLSWLQEYSDAGVFPINERFSDQPVPIFRDRRGTLCAMAYLVARSGRLDIVDGIAKTDNLARIPDLADNPKLYKWLDSVGLTLAEAARIQPTYQPPPGTVFKEDAVSATFALTSILASGASIGTGVLNLAHPSTGRGWAGLFVGASAAALGVAHLDGSSAATARVAIADILIGGAALVVGVRSLLRPRVPKPGTSRREESPQVQLSPLLLSRRGSPSLGLMLQASF
ncbi:MAG: hypothetical protein HOP28_03330 [Gemmatimonadales bacterium]|nr:hypothetical protein [Gemmatimonadales bacterium]